ncbi:hypothetical protein CR513_03164, partial [Mucuna pruriens]
MAWLWNSMTLKISRNYIFYFSTSEIWENLIETYSMKEDSTAYYDIKSKIFNSRQGTLSVTEYYGTLNELWIELDQYQGLKMCKADSVAYTRLIERGRIFKFLHGLNFEYDPIRVQILGKEKLPSLSEVFFIVRSEETRRSIMLDKGNSNTGSVMVTGKGATKRSASKDKPFIKSSRGEYGHTKDNCYKHYGNEKVLERMGGNKGSTQMWVNQTTSNKENGVEHPSTLQLDQNIQAFNHMTLFPSHFISYLKVPKRQLITIANGDHVLIAGSDNVQLHSSLSLHNVLHVPKLSNNLISINRLIQDWKFAMTFFRSHCVIQELTTGRTIGVAKEQGGLYYLQYTKIDNNTNKEELPSSQQATSKTWATSQIWLYHKCLGHPPFGLLKTMFPHLFTRHHRATFSPCNNKSIEPFDLIHSDVWGPASNSISGAKWFVSFPI